MWRCGVSYFLSLFGVVKVMHKPLFMSIEPASWCMLRCPECPVGQRGKSEHHLLTESLLLSVLDANADYMRTLIFYFQGEPLLHPHLPHLIALAKQRGLYVLLSTNAQTLTEPLATQLIASGCDRIILSLDGITQHSYEQYRVGGDLNRALQGLRYLRQAKDQLKAHTILEWQCLRLSSNEAEWDLIQKQARALGADKVSFKTAQFYDLEHGSPLMPSANRFSRYRKGKDQQYHLKKRLRNRCFRLWSGCVVTATGEVLPCCFDKAGDHSFGSLQSQSLAEIWQSPAANRFRKQVVKERKQVPICKNCTA